MKKKTNSMSILNEKALSIKLYLYQVEKIKKETYPVYARIIYRRQKADISMQMIAKVSEWDFENQLFFPAKAHNRYNNNKLLSAKDELQKIFNRLRESQSHFTVQSIRREFRGEQTLSASTKFLDYYDSYVNNCRKRPNEYGAAVVGHYMKTRRHLVNYMTEKKIIGIKLYELSKNFIAGFEQYLLSTLIEGKDHAMNKNTATTYLKKIKAVVNKALQMDLLDKNPFLGYKMPKFKNTKIVYLSTEELEALRTHDLGENKSLQRVRDLFLYGCYTGLRFSDVIALRGEDIKKDRNNIFWIRIRQKKTKEVVEIPMIDPAIELYNKYKSVREETGFVLPRISHQKVNTHLKVIASITGIKKNLTFHSSRHTFATTVTLDSGVDLKTVSKLLGHTSIKSTEIYAQVSRKKLTDVVATLNEKMCTYHS